MASIEDVMREAAARWTLITYFLLSSLLIIIFASAINLDIVNGSLAGMSVFGKDLHARHARADAFDIEKLVLGFESVFSIVLYAMCTFLAVFATAHLVPRLQEKGTIDLYLSRPIGRVRLLLSRYVAGLALAASNIVYLFGSIWLIVIWKTHVFHPRFFLAGAINLFVVATLLAFAFVVGVASSSTGVSIMSTFALFLFSVVLLLFRNLSAAFSKQWLVSLIDTLYWIVPKTTELGKAMFAYVGGDQMTRQAITISPMVYVSTAAFGVGCLLLASWSFYKKEF